jgi:Aminotransferase class-V
VTETLYLDTARLGRMSAGARRAHRDFADLAADEGGSVCFERFLRLGAEYTTSDMPSRYPGLATWGGIEALRTSLRNLAGNRPDLPVLLTNRSAQLMKLAARLLYDVCRRVLVTDLGWPAYHDILAAECRRMNGAVHTVAVREAILHDRVGEDELVERVCREYSRYHCDGLFLTTVNNIGVRLPVERIVRTLEAAHDVWFIVLDGAQDFCHVTADLRNEYCDLYVTGSHKWLGAHHPMGLGFYGRRRSRGVIEAAVAEMLKDGDLDDPLLHFAKQLESDCLDGHSETVNLAPLFSCHGAATDAAAVNRPTRFANVNQAADAVRGTGWEPVLPDAAFRSGVLLLQAERPLVRQADPATLRSTFHDKGVDLTAYDNGLIRLSMPDLPWQSDQLDALRKALLATA